MKNRTALLTLLILAIALVATGPTFYAGYFQNGDPYWGVAWNSGGIGNGRVYLCPTAGYFDHDAGAWVEGPDNPLAPLFPGLVVDC